MNRPVVEPAVETDLDAIVALERESLGQDAWTAPLIREGYADYQGEYYQANDAHNLPRGPRAAEGGPPILIGTKSPRMMGLTAQFADIWNSDWHHDASEVVPMLKAPAASASSGRAERGAASTAGALDAFMKFSSVGGGCGAMPRGRRSPRGLRRAKR